MMGRQKAPEKLFYQFRLEDHVPADHLLRQLDAVLNFDQTRTVLARHYSPLGRPSIDPELMLRMLLVGYAYGIRSERRLYNEVHLNRPIAGSAGWGWKEPCRIIRPSPRTAIAGLARATYTACYFRRLSTSAVKLVSFLARASRWMAVSSMATRAVIGASKPSIRSGKEILRPGQCESICKPSMPVIRRMRAALNICLQPIQLLHGTLRKGAAGSVTLPTI